MEETTIPRNEIIQVADVVAREKSIDKEIVFFAMEEASRNRQDNQDELTFGIVTDCHAAREYLSDSCQFFLENLQ